MNKILPTCALLAGFHAACFAQIPSPRLNSIYPPGVQRGQSVEVTLAGAHLEGLTGLHFSGPGLTVTNIEGVKLTIAAADDAPVGMVDVRAVGAWGVSNVRRFMVSDLTEIVETEPNNLIGQANETPLDCVINGRADGRSDVDYFAFTVEQGQSVFVESFAERIDSRMNPVLTLFGPDGRRQTIAIGHTGRDSRFGFTAETAGQHKLRIHDSTYDGNAEYFYRLAIHTRSTAIGVYPPVAAADATTEVQAIGANLNGESAVQQLSPPEGFLASPRLDAGLLLKPRQAAVDGFAFRPEFSALQPEPLLVGVTELPIFLENEPNDEAGQATLVTLPAELVGRIDGPGDRDLYRFSAKQGQAVQLDAYAERIGSPVDLVAVLRRIVSAEGEPINAQDVGEYDDYAANVGRTKFDTSTHDPVATISIPADGDYLLEIGDRFEGVHGGPSAAYRVRLAPPAPDFRLAVVPADEDAFSSVVARQGGADYVHVLALRKDGFNGEIRIEAANLPEGIAAPPIVIGPGMNEAPLVFSAESGDFTGAIEVRGTAQIGDQTVTRTARVGELVWSGAANAAKQSRLAQEFVLATRPNAAYRLNATPAQTTFGQGSLLTLKLTLDRHWEDFTQPLTGVAALHLPPNVDAPQATIAENQTEATMHLNFKKEVAPGTYSFLVKGTAAIPFTKTPEDPEAKKQNINVSDPSLPITVTVLAAPFELTAAPAAPEIKAGGKVAVTLSVKRANGYDGPVTASLVVPPGIEGLSAPETTIPADQTEATVEITCAEGAAAGDVPFAVFRGVSQGETPVTVDAQLTVKVAN